jgi:threonine-phosphate decarboxylase
MNEPLMIRAERDALMVSFASPAPVLSWAVLNGGMCRADHIVNCHVRGDDASFCAQPEQWLAQALVRQNPYLLVLRSLTKYYALPGLRLGYLLGETRRIAQLAAYQEPWSVNAPARKVALACLKDARFTTQTDHWLAKERAFISKQLTALGGFHPMPSQANFLLVRIGKAGGDALQLRSFLLSKNILIRACDSFAGLGRAYFRVAVRRRRDNRRLVAALREWPASCGG